MLGLTFASTSTILPAFAEHLGAPNLVIGAIPSILAVGYALPPLFSANYTERLPRKLRFILTWTAWERLPLLALAVAAYTLAESRPADVLVALLALLALMSSVSGVLMPAWMDLIGKVIPTNYRGRLFAVANVIGSGLGLGGAALAGYYLEAYPFPSDYALCFGTGFAALVGSFICLSLTVEPPLASGKPRVGFLEYLRQLPAVLARDRDFTWYLASRAIGTLGSMGSGFYTVFALRTLGAPELEVARFTFVLLAGQAVANLVFGYVADHVGNKPVLVTGALAVVVGNAVALVSGRVEEVYVVFVGLAISTAAGAVSGLNMSMEFAPPEDRPTYIGLASTLIAPMAVLTPLIGGLLADSASYRAVFAVAGLCSLLSVAVLVLRVRDPRRSAARIRSTGCTG
jgi:MFS family permease